MPSEHGDGSITRWIAALKQGQGSAAQPLWERYFDRLVRLARAELERGRRAGADADEEDAALSAFGSFCDGVARGRFPRLDDRDDLWSLLVVITLRKAKAQARRRRRLKRGGALAAPEDGPAALERAVSAEPTPELAALMAEEFQRLLHALGDEGLRQVALRRMEGYTNDEIAAQLGCALRTVARRLDLIRRTWRAEGPG